MKASLPLRMIVFQEVLITFTSLEHEFNATLTPQFDTSLLMNGLASTGSSLGTEQTGPLRTSSPP